MPIKIPQDLPASDILEKEGVLSGLINDKTVRLVFHKDVSTDDLVYVKEKIYSSSLN